MQANDTTPKNVLSFDVEDWPQSTLDFSLPVTARVRDNTLRVLDLLANAGVRGTFFVLGLAAQAYPDLVRRIQDDGHEVASHGYSHRPVYGMQAEEFRIDLRRSIALIEDAAGARVLGYRALSAVAVQDAAKPVHIIMRPEANQAGIAPASAWLAHVSNAAICQLIQRVCPVPASAPSEIVLISVQNPCPFQSPRG